MRLAYHDPGARAKAIATWAAVGGVALAAGPVLGGILTELVDWRAIFFVNVPVGIVAVLATTHAPRSPRRAHAARRPGAGGGDRRGRRAHLRRDRGGRARGRRPGGDRRRSALFAIAAVAFLAIERRSPHPAVPFDLFRSPMVATAIFAGLLFNFAFYGQVFALSLYFQEVLGHSALISGLMFLPLFGLIAGAQRRRRERSPAATGRDRR